MNDSVLCSRCLRYIKPKYAGQPYCHCGFEGTPMMTTDESVADTGGTKHDTGKPPLTLVPRAALEQAAQVFAFGARKYTRDNYKKGFDYTRLMDAALRHITQAVDGEDNDFESGLSHLAHSICCLSMALECQRLGTLKDDRFKKG